MSDLKKDIENLRHTGGNCFIPTLLSLKKVIEQAEKGSQLIINYWQDRALTAEGRYDKLFVAAKQGPQPTITFSVRGTTKQGTLLQGQKIPVEAGLIINAMDTGDA